MSDDAIRVNCVAYDFPPTPNSIVIEKLNEPTTVGDDNVLIRVHYGCLNFADVLMLGGRYQVKVPTPFVPGMEVAGVIAKIGSKVKNVKIGDSVVALTGSGGWATFIEVGSSTVMPFSRAPVSDELMRNAAALIVGHSTSHVALMYHKYGNLQKGQTVLVLGATGGVGLSAVQLAKNKGCKVIACASSDEKCNLAIEIGGADHAINYEKHKSDWFKQVLKFTNGKGVDIIYDPVGGDFTLQSLKCIAWGGKLIVIGFANGKIPSIPANLLLVKNCSAVGVFWGSHMQKDVNVILESVKELFGDLQKGLIKPYISKVYPAEQALDASLLLLERKAVGRVLIDFTKSSHKKSKL
ncbi:quinone oxidoreductase-like protein [Acrasis kona]|uniref:Quinone oxidoreductase-like protein n=1 Tax=Acrasis kona TaxID=1008807 RepID=A0AAW2ZIU6_9EUKA